MTLIYNNDEFIAIIISVYIFTYNIMNINIDTVKQMFQVYISRNSRKENIILINSFGFTCDINKNDKYYSDYAYKILEENLLNTVLDTLKLIQNLKNIKNNINELSLHEIIIKMLLYKNDIKYYCNKNIYISYITSIECNNKKIISDYSDIKEIKNDLIDIIDKTIVSTYNLDYTIYYNCYK
jgi:hypothetical protein